MSHNGGIETLTVISSACGRVVFRQPLGEWFTRDLIQRTLWLAANADRPAAPAAPAALGGLEVRADIQSVRNPADGERRISGWVVTLTQLGRPGAPVFSRAWPVSVLHGTALAVSQQIQPVLKDGRVVYYVTEDALGDGPAGEPTIDFGDEPDGAGAGALKVPDIPGAPPLPDGAIRVPGEDGGLPADVVLHLHQPAYARLTEDIGSAAEGERELAWAGPARVQRAGGCGGRAALRYEVDRLKLLDSPTATATLCPVPPDQLLDILGGGSGAGSPGPVVFIHTHTVPAQSAPNAWRFLRCSLDDLRCLHRLPMGSLGVVASSRLPLQVRAYGWSPDGGELLELSAAVAVAGQGGQ